MAEGLVKACDLSDLEEDEIFKVELDGDVKLAIYLIQGKVYATDDTCSHGQASLSEDGYVEEFTVTCSWHDGSFDVRTGEVLSLPCNIPLRTYKVDVQGDEVFVEL